MEKTYDLEELREVFPEILETQPELINIQSTGSQYNAANGIYKLFPYYQKLSPEKQLTPKDSRFIIHKHVMTGQWQLTEVYDYFWTRNIKAFPVTEENEKDALLNKFIMSHTIDEIIKTSLKAQMEVESKNETIESLKSQNGLLASRIEDNRRHIAQLDNQNRYNAKQSRINQEWELKLTQKEAKFRDLESKLRESELSSIDLYAKLIKKEHELNKTQDELNSKLIEKQNKIFDFNNSQDALKSKLIEKDNEIRQLYKNHDKMKSKLKRADKLIRDIYKTQEELKSELSKKENEICDFHKSQTKLESKLIEKENEICDFNKTENELKSKLIEKEKKMRLIYETQLELCLTPKKKQIRDVESKIQGSKKVTRSAVISSRLPASEKCCKILKYWMNQQLEY